MQLVKEKLYKSMMLLVILLLCWGIMALILFGVQQFKISSQLASVNQVANLSHLLVRQQANLFSMLLVNNANGEKLKENLDNFSKELFVLDASVYAKNGELLAQSQKMVNLHHQLGLDKGGELNANSQQIVEPIYSSKGIEGFLRVTFDSKYGQTTQNKINHIFNQLYGELIIVFLAGVVLASSLHYFLSHYRRARRHNMPEVATSKKNKSSASLSFHRRRRRLAR